METASAEKQWLALSAEKQWLALKVRLGFEKVVARSLQSRGIEWYVPMNRNGPGLSDAGKELQQPLFPGYVFRKFALTDRHQILVIPGVLLVAAGNNVPVAVADLEMNWQADHAERQEALSDAGKILDERPRSAAINH